MGRSSATYGGRAPEPLNRSGSPSPLLVRSAATTASISLPNAISPEIRLCNCARPASSWVVTTASDRATAGAETRSLFVESPARETWLCKDEHASLRA